MVKFNVLLWDFNSDSLVYYDVLPYLRYCYKECKVKNKLYSKKKNSDSDSIYYKVPKTLKEFKEFIENESRHKFWARCEYEIICHGWPVHKQEYKLDVHEQIMMNIDAISNILYNESTL